MKALRITAMIYKVKEAAGPKIKSSAGVAEALRDLADMDREGVFVLTLDRKNRVIDRHLVSLGTICSSVLDARGVYRPALLDNAASIILAHNHPSGDPSPSTDDEAITRAMKQAGELLAVPLLDHLIIGREGYYSFTDGQRTAWAAAEEVDND